MQIDPKQLTAYNEELTEEINASIANELGALTECALKDKNDTSKISLVEIYSNEDAYQSYLQSAHFKKYKKETSSMIDSLLLNRKQPILFGAMSN